MRFETVTLDQLLARLDDTTERSYLAPAEAQFGAARGALVEREVRHEEARLDLARQRRLDQLLIGQADLDAAQTEADSLEARIANQREQVVVAEREIDVRRTALEDTVIRAPFSGVAISKDAELGEIISPVSTDGDFTRTSVCTIVDMSSLEIEVDVNEDYINRGPSRPPRRRKTTAVSAHRRRAVHRTGLPPHPGARSGPGPVGHARRGVDHPSAGSRRRVRPRGRPPLGRTRVGRVIRRTERPADRPTPKLDSTVKMVLVQGV